MANPAVVELVRSVPKEGPQNHVLLAQAAGGSERAGLCVCFSLCGTVSMARARTHTHSPNSHRPTHSLHTLSTNTHTHTVCNHTQPTCTQCLQMGGEGGG